MEKPNKKSKANPVEPLCGLFTKRQAVSAIYQGCQHIHSTRLGDRDPVARQTRKALGSESIPNYAWEPQTGLGQVSSVSSRDRENTISEVIAAAGITNKRFLRERAHSVLEELITNGFYHAYRRPNGEEKYARRSDVSLLKQEHLTIGFLQNENGLFLSVADQAGTLSFQDVARSLYRCYESVDQIETKDSGAGLGTYMVFESVTHVKFDSTPGKSTTVSCWIADHKNFDPETFSFNFFERK